MYSIRVTPLARVSRFSLRDKMFLGKSLGVITCEKYRVNYCHYNELLKYLVATKGYGNSVLTYECYSTLENTNIRYIV